MSGTDLDRDDPADPIDVPDDGAGGLGDGRGETARAEPAHRRGEADAPIGPLAGLPGTGRERLAALEARVREDLAMLNRPPPDWVPERTLDGEAVRDVVVVGGGMCGLVAWHALQVAGVRDVRVIDRAAAGREGPWVGYARMETLRSPKQLTGPAYGMASLTFRAWFVARFGEAAWEGLERIPRRMWMDYLGWYARVLDAPVENGVTLVAVEPVGEYLRLTLDDGAERHSVVVRRLVLATGRDGTGKPTVPDFVQGVPRERWAHSSEDIDFDALAGRRVAVVGVGASAVDNAAEALEAGAREVRLLIRRERMPTINKLMGIGSYGFLAAFPSLPDAWRWRLIHYSFATQTPAPHGSTLRVGRHANAFFHFGRRIESIGTDGAGLELRFDDGARLLTDYLILGTGFFPDPAARPELGEAAKEIRLWGDVHRPPEEERDAELASYPWLGADFAFREREPGRAPWLERVHCFNYGAVASAGKVSGDIPGISEGAAWLAREIAAAFYREDIERHWRGLEAYDKPELSGDEWVATELPDADDPVLAAIERRAEVFVHDAHVRAAVLSPRTGGALSRELRHALALRVARLEGSEALERVLEPALARTLAERGERVAGTSEVADFDDDTLVRLADPARGVRDAADTSTERLRAALLGFVDGATREPETLGAEAIAELRRAGLGVPDIVGLTQLVAYFAWRLRLLAGLDALGASAPIAPGAATDGGALQPLHELGARPRFTGPPIATGAIAAAGASGTAAEALPANAADTHGDRTGAIATSVGDTPAGGAADVAADGAASGAADGAADGPAGGAAGGAPVQTRFTLEVPHWRPRVPPIDLASASDEQRAALGVTPSNRPVSDYVLVLAHEPGTLAPRSPLFNAVMYGRGGASRAERELATTAISRLNGCVFCAATHASRLAQLVRDDTLARAVLERDPRADPDALSIEDPRARAIVRFAERLTRAPHALGRDDVAALREAGLEAEEIVDLVLASALFGWANRLMHLLGDPVAVEEEADAGAPLPASAAPEASGAGVPSRGSPGASPGDPR